MTSIEEFDGSMIFCMKTLLSYYEKKRDRILSDYLYQLAIPLIVKILYLYLFIKKLNINGYVSNQSFI